MKYIPATNIDFYLSKRDTIKQYDVMELYCHPHYKEGVFLDDSPSYLKHELQPLLTNIAELRKLDGLEFVTWQNYS